MASKEARRRAGMQAGLNAQSDARHMRMASKLHRQRAEDEAKMALMMIERKKAEIAKLEEAISANDEYGMNALIRMEIKRLREDIKDYRARHKYWSRLLLDQHYLLTGEHD